jgi:GNAT superfamily N-acetyltransferase
MARRARSSPEGGRRARPPSSLLAAVPDLPRWVETRAMLLSGRCTVVRAPGDRSSFVVSSTDSRLISVVGAPAVERILLAAGQIGSSGALIAPIETRGLVARALPQWRAQEAVIHTLPGKVAAARSDADVRLLPAAEVRALDGTPPDLARDLALAKESAPVAVAFEGGRAVGFCYAGWETESLWDVSVDTVQGYRNRGYATASAERLIERMAARGRRPVWGALESNEPSRRVASKLGFVAVDRLVVFFPPTEPREVHW